MTRDYPSDYRPPHSLLAESIEENRKLARQRHKAMLRDGAPWVAFLVLLVTLALCFLR